MAIDKGTDEYFKKLKLATDLCSGNVDMAKKLLSGEFKDSLAIKGRFKDEGDSSFGLFLIIINQLSVSRLYNSAIVADYASVFDTKPFVDWKTFLAKISKELEYDNYNKNLTNNLSALANKNVNQKNIKKIFDLVRVNDILQLTTFFEKIVGKSINKDTVNVTVDFEQISSIEIGEKLGISLIDTISEAKSANENHEKLEKLIQEIKTLENEFKGRIVKAKTEVSPIKGKYIHEIKRGDQIYVIINDNSQLAISIAKQKGVYSVGKMGAFPAPIIVNAKTKNGYMMYVGPVEDAIFKISEKPGIKLNVVGYEKDKNGGSPKSAKREQTQQQTKQQLDAYSDLNKDELEKFKSQEKRTYVLFILLPLLIVALIIFIYYLIS